MYISGAGLILRGSEWIMNKIVTTVYAIILGLKERIKLVDLAILQLVAKGFFMLGDTIDFYGLI